MSEIILALWAALLGAVILPNGWILSPPHGAEVRTGTMPQGMAPSPNGELIAVGRYDRLDDPTQAEVAFVVVDAFQHHGIATMLLHRLAARARKAGIRCLIAEVPG